MKNLYLMTEAQIESLAHERTTSLATMDGLDGTYLRAIVTGAQSKLGTNKRGKRPTNETQIEAIEGIAVVFYAAVLRGVMTPDIVLGPELAAEEVSRRTRERNRRATFARTAKSTLVAWVEAGGDVRGLDVGKLTKNQLRAEVTAANAERGVTAVSRIEKAQAAILSVVAREGPDAGREHLERVIATLQAALDEMAGEADHGHTTVLRSEGAPVAFRGHMRRVPATSARASPA